MNNRIYVTKPYLPPLDEFNIYLKAIWENKILTNNGPFHQELEENLSEFLGVEYLSLFSNGTLALITAFKALEIKGEVITTPFSFVATSHALLLNGIKPVFTDIENDTFTLDPNKIEAAITTETTAILPVHVYGNPCKVNEIQNIANAYGLKVIYDSAHSFGCKLNNIPIAVFGDLSIFSFHATKVFHTFEGGAIVSKTLEMKEKIDHFKNFGFEDEITVSAPGINAKMNEVQAAMGLLQMKYFDKIISLRNKITDTYHHLLKNINGIRLPGIINCFESNFAYFPIIIDKLHYGISRDELYTVLLNNNIFTRRYFYPLISNFPTYTVFPSANPNNLPVANKIADTVLCLPIYPDLSIDDVVRISSIIKQHSA